MKLHWPYWPPEAFPRLQYLFKGSIPFSSLVPKQPFPPHQVTNNFRQWKDFILDRWKPSKNAFAISMYAENWWKNRKCRLHNDYLQKKNIISVPLHKMHISVNSSHFQISTKRKTIFTLQKLYREFKNGMT